MSEIEELRAELAEQKAKIDDLAAQHLALETIVLMLLKEANSANMDMAPIYSALSRARDRAKYYAKTLIDADAKGLARMYDVIDHIRDNIQGAPLPRVRK